MCITTARGGVEQQFERKPRHGPEWIPIAVRLDLFGFQRQETIACRRSCRLDADRDIDRNFALLDADAFSQSFCAVGGRPASSRVISLRFMVRGELPPSGGR